MKPIPEEEKGRETYDVTEDDLGGYLEGERLQIEEVMDKVIVISAIDVRPSDFSDGDYAVVQMVWNDEALIEQPPYTFTTSSGVLLKQLKRLKDRMPIRTKIVAKVSEASGREYYTLAPPDWHRVKRIKERKFDEKDENQLTFTESEVKRGY